jgi:hypothetical protein
MGRAAVSGSLLACALATLAAPATAGEAAGGREAVGQAWWTGPLLAPSANTLPQGHILFEPYVYDVIADGRFDASGARRSAPRAQTVGSQSYLNYGLFDGFTVGLIPRFGYAEPSLAPHSSGLQAGDLTLQAQYQLTRYREGALLPALSLNLQETLPTGRWDRLDRLSDGFGAGDFQTAAALYAQTYFWAPNGRIVRARLDLTYSVSGSAAVEGMSVYGTSAGFRGRAAPGDSATADLAFEYSATRNWVLALDLWFERDADTKVVGRYPGGPGFRADSGASKAFYLAPAVEYNFTAAVGLIAGARLEPAGRNAGATLTPVAALNLVF